MLKSLLAIGTILLIELMLIRTSFAQAPSGTISNSFSGPVFGLYDVTGLITNFSEPFTPKHDTNWVIVSENVNLLQSITGDVTASSTSTVITVQPMLTNAFPTISFPAAYKVKGVVRSADGPGAMVLALTLTGQGVHSDTNGLHQYTESLTYTFVIVPSLIPVYPPFTNTLSITKSGSISISGKNGSSAKLPLTNIQTTANMLVPLDWTLSMNLITSNLTKVTGTATVTLVNDRTFTFNAKGTYVPQTGLTKLTLTSLPPDKGATLTVILSGNNVSNIRGALLGQKVNFPQVLPM